MHRVEGNVICRYEVNEEGMVHNISVINGLGYGCDNEAKRLINLLDYSQVNNRGIKVNTKLKIRIYFKLPPVRSININYIYKESSS